MSGAPYFSGEGPSRPHLSTGEVADLRGDVARAFDRLQQDLSIVAMLDAPNVGGGGTTVTVGFQILGVTTPMLAEFAVFDDANYSIPATNATLNTAAVGTIVAGAGGPALKVLTDASGAFRVTLTDLADETVFLACFETPGGPVLVGSKTDSVTFSA